MEKKTEFFFPTLENSYSKVRKSCELRFGGVFKHTKQKRFFGFAVCYGNIYCMVSIAFQKIFSKWDFDQNWCIFINLTDGISISHG